MLILGVSSYYHDSAACLVHDGKIICAAQEERFTRIKHDASFPTEAINFCLKQSGFNCADVDSVVFYEKPFIKFERLIETYLAFAPLGFTSFAKSMPLWLKDKIFQKNEIVRELSSCLGAEVDWAQRLLFSDHHLSHAASAYYPSPYENALVLVMDGVGEWATTSAYIGKGNQLKLYKSINFPHSLGLLYSAFTYFLGFKVNSGEYKVMGLAPYGEPKYFSLIKENLINISDDGSYSLNMEYFSFSTSLRMTNKKFEKLFDLPRRIPESDLSQQHMDIAASLQAVLEYVILGICANLQKETQQKNLCLAGGVALNCVANGHIVRSGLFDNVWVQPAAGDAGGAVGAALSAYHLHHGKERKHHAPDGMSGTYLGPEYSDLEIIEQLNEAGAVYHSLEENDMISEAASCLAKQMAVGWMQGRMEFGPRALGNRSILADPRSPEMQKQLNLKVKFRESFRPFAPSVLCEHTSDWFELDRESPYMLLVANVSDAKRKNLSNDDLNKFGIDLLNVPKSTVPAVTHVDFSARIQTVSELGNKKYYKLISQFNDLTGCPILVNTSFNVRGEPIVCSPKDAYRCFMGSHLDVLVINNFIMYKDQQPSGKKMKYHSMYELD